MNEFLLVIFTFGVFVLAHIGLLHLIGPREFIRNGTVLLIGFLLLPVLPWGGKLIFISLWNMYMFALICSRNSVSLRILDEVMRAPGEAMSKEKLLELFSDRESLGARVSLMEKNHFLRFVTPSEIELSAKGRMLAGGILLARSLFGVKNPG